MPRSLLKPIDAKPPTNFIIECKLSDGSFESSLTLPINCNLEYAEAALDGWAKAMHAGMSATFGKGTDATGEANTTGADRTPEADAC